MRIIKSNILPVFMLVLVACSTGGGKVPEGGDSEEGLAEIHFTKTDHDFGKIVQGETVGYNFEFASQGETALMILEAKAGCGCTVPRYSRKPILPGENGTIEVVFDSSGRMGKQTKSVTIRSNAKESSVVLTIRAEIYSSES